MSKTAWLNDHDLPGSDNSKGQDENTLFGGDVYLVRKRKDGSVEREFMPVAIAVAMLAYDERNGDEFISGHIYDIDGDIDLGLWDRSV